MSNYARASGIVDAPLEKVWGVLRDFSFPKKIFSGIKECACDGGVHSVGTIRTLKWEKEVRTQKLLSLDDRFHRMSWELLTSEHGVETNSAVTTLRITRITDTNQTLVVWETEFGTETDPKMVAFEQKAYQLNIKDINAFMVKLTGKKRERVDEIEGEPAKKTQKTE